MIDQQVCSAVLLAEHGRIAVQPRVHYVQHAFVAPEGATCIKARLRFHKERLCQLFLALFDVHGFRGCHMQPGAQGKVDLVLLVAHDTASRGGIPGPIPVGAWYVQIYVERLADDVDYMLTVEAEFGAAQPYVPVQYPVNYISRAVPADSASTHQRWRDWTTLLAFSNPIWVAEMCPVDTTMQEVENVS